MTTKGTEPYVEEYKIALHIRTIVGADREGPLYRDAGVITVALPPDYPMRLPKTVMVSAPQPFHPNWFTSKNWCFGTWSMSEVLGDHVIRMVKTLQFDLDITNEHSPANGAVTLYLLPSAFEEIRAHISWGKRTRGTVRGQGGILIGSVYRDWGTDFVCGVARHIVPAARAGDATYIQFTHADRIAMYRELEARFTAAEGEEQLSVIGWYHTHPDMPVQMSGIDKSTHTSFFPHPWQFSVILSPQRKVWAIFNGALCGNCSGYLYTPPVAAAEPRARASARSTGISARTPLRHQAALAHAHLPRRAAEPRAHDPALSRRCAARGPHLLLLPREPRRDSGGQELYHQRCPGAAHGRCDCLLWINPRDTNAFEFYAFGHPSEAAPAAPLPAVGPLGDLLGRLTAPLDGRAAPELRYVQTEYDGISRGKRPLAIDRRRLAQRV